METAVDLVKRFPKRVLRNSLIKMNSIDVLFGDAAKQYLVPERDIYTPEVTNMEFFSRAEFLQSQHYHFPGGYTTELNDVIYHTGDGVLTNLSRAIMLESINGWQEKQKFSLKEVYLSKPHALDPKNSYSVFRSTNNGYYHTIIDNLPRLYLLSQLENPFIKLLIPGKLTKVENFFLDRLLPTNVSLEFIEPGKSYLIDKLIFPSFMTRPFSGYLPSEYLTYLYERVLPKRPRRKVNRIFISRGVNTRNPRKQRRRITNEDLVFEKLEPYGFKKYRLEDISLEEQVALFYDADFVVGAHGAGLANIVFSEEIKVLELFASDCILPYYFYLAKSLGHKYFYLYGDRNSIHADFSANIAKIIEIVKVNC